MTSDAPPGTTVLRLRPDRTQRLEALLLGAGPHLESVLDIGSATNGDLLLVLPAPTARLTDLLVAPGALTAGEAVTVLVPLAQALRRLHEAGVVHGGVRPGAVVLDADGSPAWTAPVAPVLLRKVGPTPFAAGVAEDVAAFGALCRVLLEPLGIAVPEGDGLDHLAAALFGIAAAEPVRLVRAGADRVAGTPARLLPAVEAETPAVPPSPWSGRLALVLAQARGVRLRAWAVLGGVAALLVAAVTLLPAGGAAPAAPVTIRPSAHPARSVPPTPVAGRHLAPAAAIRALLAERDRCLAAGDRSCIRRVDALDSPALTADLRAAEAGVEAIRVDRSGLTVTAVSGGTALATVGGASVLAIRDRDGWRLRDVVAKPPDAG